MVNTLVITDGQPYTHEYVNMMREQGHKVYVQVSPTMAQTTNGRTRHIDLFNKADVVKALEDIAFVVIIGDPHYSNNALTQGHVMNLERLIYDNLATAMHQAGVQKCLAIQARLNLILEQTLADFNIDVIHQKIKVRHLKWGKRALYQLSKETQTVRSIQALDIPENVSMDGVTSMYGRFLKTLNGRLINGVYDGTRFTIILMPFKLPLIQMYHDKTSDPVKSVVLNITGGLLVKRSGRIPRLEFRRLEGDTTTCLIALHDFVPRLPWGVYRVTQAPMHRFVSYLFRQYWHQFK